MQHRILFQSRHADLFVGSAQVLAPAVHFVNGTTVKKCEDNKSIRYVHLLFDRHEIVNTGGLWTESFHPGVEAMDGLGAKVRQEILKLFPDLADEKEVSNRAQAAPTEDDTESRHLNGLIDRIDVTKGMMCVQLNLGALLPAEKTQQPIHATFEISFQKRQNGRAKPIVIAPPDAPQPDQDLINLVADARRWSAELLDGRSSTIRQIEEREGLRSGSVSRILPLAWLAPDISTAILEGRQPQYLSAKKLRSLPDLPLDWQDQRKILGVPRP